MTSGIVAALVAAFALLPDRVVSSATGMDQSGPRVTCTDSTVASRFVTTVASSAPCEIRIGVPNAAQASLRRLHVVRIDTSMPGVVFAAELTATISAPWDGQEAGPSSNVATTSTDGAGTRQMLLFWSYPAGNLRITRHDTSEDPADIEVRIEEAPPVLDLLADGYSARLTIAAQEYRRLIDFAMCARGEPGDNDCFEKLAGDEKSVPAGLEWSRGLRFNSNKDRLTAHIYYLVSRWIGRDPSIEFDPSEAVDEYASSRASKSEPLIVFVGAGSANRIVMLDCQGLETETIQRTVSARRRQSATYRRCDDFANPLARTLERARSFWAIYIEDDDAPFDTTIEVDYRGSRRDPDYEEFDPRLLSHRVSGNDDSRGHTIRIGVRQFRLREAPSVVDLAFTRQGSGYGVRQWLRVFRQRSQLWLVPAAAVFATAVPSVQRTAQLAPVFAPGSAVRSAYEVVEEQAKRGAYALLALQWPQLRAKADDARALRRFAINLVPDAALGMGSANLLFTGGSWPVPLWRDRTFVTVGLAWAKETRPPDGLQVGDRLGLEEAAAAILPIKWDYSVKVGLTFELFKLRR